MSPPTTFTPTKFTPTTIDPTTIDPTTPSSPSTASGHAQVSKKTRKSLTAKGIQTQQLVIQAGIDCIAQLGFHAASTNKIAQQAGVTWGVIQHQFGDKAALLEAIIDFAYNTQMNILKQASDSNASLEQRVTDLIDAFWQIQISPTSTALHDIIRNVLNDKKLRAPLIPKLQEIKQQHDVFWRDTFFDTNLSQLEFETAKQFSMATLRGLAEAYAIRSSSKPILLAKEQLKTQLFKTMEGA